MTTMRSLLLSTLVTTACAWADEAAVDDGIVTDRPDQTESAVVVQPGQLQIETGIVYSDEDDARTLSFPTTLFRVGLVKRFELRVDMGGIDTELDTDTSGLSDLAIGGKVRLWDEKGWVPEAALLFGATLPVGEDAPSSRRVDPDFRFSFAHTINDRIGIGYNLGMTWETEDVETSPRLFRLLTGRERSHADTTAFFNYTLTTGIGLTDRLGLFLEVFGDVPVDGDAAPAHYFDGGFTWAPRPNLQFDASAGIGLSDAAADYFVSTGVSIRLPK